MFLNMEYITMVESFLYELLQHFFPARMSFSDKAVELLQLYRFTEFYHHSFLWPKAMREHRQARRPK